MMLSLLCARRPNDLAEDCSGVFFFHDFKKQFCCGTVYMSCQSKAVNGKALMVNDMVIYKATF